MSGPRVSRAAAISAALTIAGCAAFAAWCAISWPSPEPFGITPSAPRAEISPAAGAITKTPEKAEADRESSTAIDTKTSKPDDQRPSFDVVRVEPTGDALVAGHFATNAEVELRVDGRRVAQATANSSGDFFIVPPPLEAGAHRLELAAKSEMATPVVSNVVTVDVPAQATTVPLGHATVSEAAAPTPQTPFRPAVQTSPMAGLRQPASVVASRTGSERHFASRLHAQSSRARELLRLSRSAEERRDQDLLASVAPSVPQSERITIQGGGHTTK
jgi:hypothetical protein